MCLNLFPYCHPSISGHYCPVKFQSNIIQINTWLLSTNQAVIIQSGGNQYLITCSICKLASLQRNQRVVLRFFLILQTKQIELMPNSSTLVSSVHKTSSQAFLDSFRCSLANLSQAFIGAMQFQAAPSPPFIIVFMPRGEILHGPPNRVQSMVILCIFQFRVMAPIVVTFSPSLLLMVL